MSSGVSRLINFHNACQALHLNGVSLYKESQHDAHEQYLSREKDSCSMRFASLSRLVGVASSLDRSIIGPRETWSISHVLGFNSHQSHHHVELASHQPLSNWLHPSSRLIPQWIISVGLRIIYVNAWYRYTHHVWWVQRTDVNTKV